MSILSWFGLPDDYFSNPDYSITYSQAKELYDPPSSVGEFAGRVVDNFHSASDASEASDMLGVLGQYFSQLFETEANAAKIQAESNEAAAVNAWKRSELAADAALARARKFRQTSALDNVQALKAAGLNPVLAAGGGFSGSAVTAPQANAPASSSSKADGLNAADLLTAIAALLGGAGSLIGSLSPKRIISDVTSNVTGNYTNRSTSTSENTSWIYHMGKGGRYAK